MIVGELGTAAIEATFDMVVTNAPSLEAAQELAIRGLRLTPEIIGVKKWQ